MSIKPTAALFPNNCGVFTASTVCSESDLHGSNRGRFLPGHLSKYQLSLKKDKVLNAINHSDQGTE